MEADIIVKEILNALNDLGDPGRRKFSKNYFPTSMKVIGVSNPDLKEVIKVLKSRHKDWSVKDWVGLCKALVNENIFECQVLAYEILGRNRKLLNALTREEIKELGKNLDNWASVDHFSVGIHGVLWGMGVVTDADIDKLLASPNFWERRVAVVSTVALNLKSRGGTGDTPRTISVCERVVDDHNDMIQKALSWALRELSKRDRQAVSDFMERHDSHLAGRVVREVNHKLLYGTKN